MLALAQFIAVFATTLFAGAAMYISLVEHPARLGCATYVAHTVWAPSYQRAVPVMASLAVIGFLAGFTVWILSAGMMWLLAALLILSVVPITLLVIFPTNKLLLMPNRDANSDETRALLIKWGKLHAIRSALSLVATVIYIWQLAVA